METGRGTTKKGYSKVERCCSVARHKGLEFAWIDTLCIDKTSSVELSEAINSMYRWYSEAHLCLAYLADVSHSSALVESEWFCRGWTLQELIAPSALLFFNKSWHELGTKEQLVQAVSKRTGISILILLGKSSLDTASIAQRMSWAAKRTTTRVEDRAYSLMGIFGINMPLLYGEGKRAFVRLQEEILKISDDDSIFAWQSPHEIHGGILATSPEAFRYSATVTSPNSSRGMGSPLTISNKGIHMELNFIGLCSPGIGLAFLQCRRKEKRESLADRKRAKRESRIVIYLRDVYLTFEYFERLECNILGLLHVGEVQQSQLLTRTVCIRHRPNSAGVPSWASLTMLKGLAFDSQQAELVQLLQTARNIGANRIDEDGMTLLMHSAANREKDNVWLLLTRKDARLNHVDMKKRTALWYAVGAGSQATVSILLSKSGIKVDSKDEDGCTPLSCAATKGYVNIVRQLIDTGKADLESADQNGLTPLSLSVLNAQESVLITLLENGADVDTRDQAGRTPLFIAVETGSIHMLRSLLENGADSEIKSGDGQTPLSLAARKGHDAACKLLLELGAPPLESLESKDNSNKTPLVHAAEKGYEQILELLLYYGADVEAKSLHDWTPLFHAVQQGHELIVGQLVDAGADASAQDSFLGKTPLLLAIENGHEQIVKLLLESGTDMKLTDKYANPPLILAAKLPHGPNLSITRLLLEKGADPNPKDALERTPLLWATRNRNAAVVDALLRGGADTEIKDKNSETALSLAVQMSSEPIVKSLLERGAATDVYNGKSSRTPLIWSSITGHGDIARLLLEHGAETNVIDQSGRTPLWNAVYGDHEDVVRLLLEHGVKQGEKNAMLGAASDQGKQHLVRLLIENGADVNSQDDYGSPLKKAIDKHHHRIVKLLVEKGADIESEGEYRAGKIRDVLRLSG